MTIVLTLVGTALLLVTLRDIFHQLFLPSSTGSASATLIRAIWRLFRWLANRRPAMLSLAGPLAVVAVIVSWAAGLAIGWALIYWPHLGENFLFQTGLDPQEQTNFAEALYLSLVTLFTLGYGDIVPTAGPLRLLAPIEAMLGFALVTAGITWVLSIYPAIIRRRTLGQQMMVLRDVEYEGDQDVVRADPETTDQIFRDLATQLLNVRSDLVQFYVTYYFHSRDESSSLASGLPYLTNLAERGLASDAPQRVQLAAAILKRSLDDLAATLGPRFLRLSSASTEEVFEAYARDHGRKSMKSLEDVSHEG